MKKVTLLCSLFLFTWAQAAPKLNHLTLDEIIGQTLVVRIDVGEQAKYEKAVKDGLIGTVLIKGGSLEAGHAPQKRAATLQTIADLRTWEKQSRHQIPLLIAFDYEGGAVVSPLFLGLKQMPSNLLMSASSAGPSAIYDMFRASGREIKSMGGQISFAPDMDVNTNAQNPIIGTRSFGSDAKTVGQNGTQAFKGLQKEKVAAFAKHFPGHGDTVVDSHLASPVMDLPLEELKAKHINAFQKAIDKGIWGIMSSHVIYPALDAQHPSTFSHKILTELLRKEMKFKGVVATDSLDMEGAKREFGIAQAAAEAYAAGADMPLIGRDLPYNSISYAKSQIGKTLTEQQLRQSAQRVLDLKKKTGLFSPTKKENKKANALFENTATLIARSGVTLVKNNADLLPIKKETQSVCAVFFSEPILKEQIQAVLLPFERALWKTELVYTQQTPETGSLEKARACAKNAGIVIVGSTQKYNVPDSEQKKIIETLLEENANAVFLSVLNPYDIAFYPRANTVLAVYGPTKESMRAAGDVILGNLAASGKMPVSF